MEPCIICLETCNGILCCSHCTAVYHPECIKEMIRISPCYNKCPQCRNNLPSVLKTFIHARENDIPNDEVDEFWNYIFRIILMSCHGSYMGDDIEY